MLNIFKRKSQFLEDVEVVLSEMGVAEKPAKLVVKTFKILDKNYEMYSSFSGSNRSKKKFREELLVLLKSLTSIEIDESVDAKALENNYEEVTFSLYRGNKGRPETKKIYKHSLIYKATEVNKITSSIKVIDSPISLWYGLIMLKPRRFHVDSRYLYGDVLRKIMIESSIDSEMQILRDFNEYSWNKVHTDVIPYEYKIIYNNLLLLVGPEFIKLWKDGGLETDNYLGYIYNKMKSKISTEGCLKEYVKKLNSMIYLLADKEERDHIDKVIESNTNTLNMMKDVKTFSEYLTTEKKALNKLIRNIDTVINNSKKLLEAFSKRKANKIIEDVDQNPNIKQEDKEAFRKKIDEKYTIEDYKSFLNVERKNAEGKIKEYSTLQNPERFLKYKDEFFQQVEVKKFLDSGDYIDESGDVNAKNLEKLVIDQEKLALDLIYRYIDKITDVDEIYFNILMIRRIRFLKFGENVYGFSNVDLYQKMDKILKVLIANGVKKGLILKASVNENDNYGVVSHAFKTTIANFKDVRISVYKGRTILLNIYNQNVLNNEIELFDITPETIILKSKKRVKLVNDEVLKNN